MAFDISGRGFLEPFFSTSISFFFLGSLGETVLGLEERLPDTDENAVKLTAAFFGSERRGGGALGARPDWDALKTTMSPLFHWILL